MRTVLILVVAIAASLQSEARPNLSGTWKHAAGAVAAVEMRLEQTDTDLKIHKAGFPIAVYRFDDTETSSVHQPPIPADSIVTRRFAAKWADGRLVVRVSEEARTKGYSLGFRYTQETMYLETPDRLILEVQRLEAMHGAQPQGPAGTSLRGPALMVVPGVKKTVYVRAKSN